MIATVISADMDTVAQSAPGAKTRFVAERNRGLEKLRDALA